MFKSCLLCLYGNRECPGSFQNKLVGKLFFQMSAQEYSAPGQTEGRMKTFLEWKSIDLSHELSLTCWGNVNYYKSVHHPISARENRGHPGNYQNKSLSSAFSWVLIFYLLKWNRYFSACKRKFLESTGQFSFKFCVMSTLNWLVSTPLKTLHHSSLS